MMKKILAIIIPILVFSFYTPSNAQISNYTGLTAEQLSGITSGVTNIASKDYWTTNAYAQIAALMEFVSANAVGWTANDTTPAITDASLYYTQNTSTTMIDSIGYATGYTSARKFILVIVEDAYTQVNHLSGSIDCGGVDIQCNNGDILLFIRDDTNSLWRCKFLFLQTL